MCFSSTQANLALLPFIAENNFRRKTTETNNDIQNPLYYQSYPGTYPFNIPYVNFNDSRSSGS